LERDDNFKRGSVEENVITLFLKFYSKQTSAYKNNSTKANAVPSTPTGNSKFSLFSRNNKEIAWNMRN